MLSIRNKVKDRGHRISNNLAVRLSFWMTVILALSFGVFLFQQSRLMHQQLEKQMGLALKDLQSAISIPLWSYDTQSLRRVCLSTFTRQDVHAIQVSGQDGNIYLDTTKSTEDLHPFTEITSIAAEINYKNRHLATLTLKYSDHSIYEELFRNLLYYLLLLIPVNLLLFFFSGLLLRRSLSLPFQEMETLMHQVAAGEYRDIQSRATAEEFAPIVSEFTGMAAKVEKREQDLKTTLYSIGDGVISTDESGCITQMNPVAEQLTGWQLKEAEGKAIEDIFHLEWLEGEDLESHPVHKCLRSNDLYSFGEFVNLKSREGINYLISESAAPIRNDLGIVEGVVLVFRNVTEQVELENKLQQSQKMDAIGQLAGGIAHDFNNMLNGIIGAAELLKEELGSAGNLNEETSEFIEIIRQSAEQSASLTRRLLDFARKGKIISEPTHFNKVLEDTVQLLKRSIDPKIDLKIHLAEGDPMILADASQLQNTLLNLGINARDAMPNGGTLSYHVDIIKETNSELVKVPNEVRIGGSFLLLRVKDTGSGIAPELLKNIFEPFFTTKSTGKGTGLGLASVYGTVKQHKGEITVRSEEGVGTEFFLSFPLTSETAVISDDAEMQTVTTGGKHILVVDDNDQIRALTAKSLQKLGYSVKTAENGKEAVLLVQAQNNFDLVIMDMIMPKMNGREAFEEIQKTHPTLPVIFISGYSQGNLDPEFLEQEQVRGFLHKPVRNRDLKALLLQVLH